jgi:hypothetical protein
MLKQNQKWYNEIIALPTMDFMQQNEVGYAIIIGYLFQHCNVPSINLIV